LVNDAQGDQKIISILRDMGATIDIHEDRVHIRGPQELTGIDIDCGDIPDLGPILTVIGCFARGTTRIRNIAHLKFKESNRILFPALELIKLGADIKPVEETGEIIVKYSSPNLKGGHVSACNDHRVAMSLAVAGLRIKEPVVINGFEAVHKSYPLFVDHLKQIQADVTLEVV
jgi:3-phosphoshikimate 1-carboxyvinyltransferase